MAGRVRRQLRIGGFAQLLAAVLATASLTTLASPASPSPRVPVTNPYVLINRCKQIAAVAHPWRARQIDSAIVRYQLAMSYRSVIHVGYNLRELAMMRASEIRAADNLEETCRIGPSAASVPPLPSR
ncbi:hypothetical protein E4T66_13850 [Sinimarinibacterium sp. CAU 1509]|uniref:hypothetical protein n=1 Tax=Sinimarinibacterium sp. CAU 1509 TaxID=2562283 RepID=UPI0010AB7283|nr:hypothetical protein [Sinimarinibacterium sp. CAU 1509]TJY59462.1 hypothetical protein E4T66_13850 [Sinimarinibacterium sp. CAU 1509]